MPGAGARVGYERYELEQRRDARHAASAMARVALDGRATLLAVVEASAALSLNGQRSGKRPAKVETDMEPL
jgi:hypothetical protein